jgi:hypothetical protein
MNALTNVKSGGSSLGEMMQMSEMLAKSSMVPTAYRGKPQDVLVCLMWGQEVGLGAIQALNGISVINGKPALWGDAALALVRGHPACAGIREWSEGEGEKMVAFCEAGLWGKPGPWQQYGPRMLQMRARGFAIRDVFPDALRGVITAEEAQDYPAPRDVPNMAAPPPGSQAAVMTALQSPSDTTLPLVGPDGVLYQIARSGDRPAVIVWMSAARKAIGKLEDAAALRMWRAEMGPYLAEISESEPEAVKAVEDAIQARLAALSPPDEDLEPGSTEPEDEGKGE